MSNFRRAAVAAAAAGFMASALVGVSPAGAQEDPETLLLIVTPTSGPSGTVISVSGGQCGADEAGDLEARFALITDDTDDVVTESAAEPDVDGDWAGELTVPDGTDPDVDYHVAAACVLDDGEGEWVIGEYDYVPFDVTAGGTTPTTAPEVPETPDTVAPVATPVVAQPTFTG